MKDTFYRTDHMATQSIHPVREKVQARDHWMATVDHIQAGGRQVVNVLMNQIKVQVRDPATKPDHRRRLAELEVDQEVKEVKDPIKKKGIDTKLFVLSLSHTQVKKVHQANLYD